MASFETDDHGDVPTDGIGPRRHVVRYDLTPLDIVGRLAAPLVGALMQRSRKVYRRRLRAALVARV